MFPVFNVISIALVVVALNVVVVPVDGFQPSAAAVTTSRRRWAADASRRSLDDGERCTSFTTATATATQMTTKTSTHGLVPVALAMSSTEPSTTTMDTTIMTTSEEETTTSDFASAMPKAPATYESLGIEEGKLALGVKPDEVLKYIGTREDLIAKTLEDIPSFDRPKAESEVDKFLLDAEMVNLYIQYQKEKEKNPDFEVPGRPAEDDNPGFFSIRTVLIVYIVYIFGSTGLSVLKNWVLEQQAAGTWQGTPFPAVNEWIDNSLLSATAAASSSTTTTTTTTAAVFDTLSSAMLAASLSATTETAEMAAATTAGDVIHILSSSM